VSPDAQAFAAQIIAVLSLAIMSGALAMAVADTAMNAGQLFYRRQVAEAEMNRQDLFVTANPVILFWINLAALVVCSGVAHYMIGSWIVTALVATFILIFPGMYWRKLRKQRFRMIEEQLPDAFMMLASSLQAGASINMAFQNAASQISAPLSQELSLVVRKVQIGVSLDDALLEMETRAPIDSVIMANSAVRISREIGGSLVDTIKGMAETLRRKFSMEGKINSLTAQGKAQGRFMAALPIIVGIGLSFLDTEAMSKLVTTPVGYGVTAVMIVMQIMGFIFINKTTSIDT